LGRSTQNNGESLLRSAGGRSLLACLAVLAGFIGAAVWGWNHYSGELAAREDFKLARDEILITSPPNWVQSNILSDALDAAQLPEQLDLRDRQLTARIASAVSSHPWVKSVDRVVKQYPAKVIVQLQYRTPIAMVEVVDEKGRHGLIPIDTEAVVLPTADFSPSQAAKFPRINVGRTPVRAMAGLPWDSPEMAEAASIAMLLVDHWERLNLKRIVLRREGVPHYELELNDQSFIIWGSPPGKELPQESVAQHKVQVMLKHATEATLTQGEPKQLDLRTAGRSVISR